MTETSFLTLLSNNKLAPFLVAFICPDLKDDLWKTLLINVLTDILVIRTQRDLPEFGEEG